MKRRLLLAGIVSAGLPFFVMNIGMAIDVDITGQYKCKGKNVDGSTYDGTANITKKGSVYYVKWSVGKQNFNGIGILQGNVLAVSYYGNFSGVAAYRIESSSRLVGRWTTRRQGTTLNTETLTR
ncbi:MAG TPA: hypothetical protein IGS40_21300 [Trichormus sp. M33_DOE_039]|nr:hypothetical protein [Trichormus sp. M33_DOE_039]